MRAAEVRAGGAAALARLVTSPLTGVVRSLAVRPDSGALNAVRRVSAFAANYGMLPCGGAIADPGAGDPDPDRAMEKALFELIERYCAAFLDADDALLSKPSSPRFLHGDRLPLFAPFQYKLPDWPFAPLTEDSEVRWVQAVSLRTAEPLLVPASLVHVPYRPCSGDDFLGPSTSTGMAAAWSWTAACLAGYMEVCERDAFAIMWMNRLSLPRIAVPPASPMARELERIGGAARIALVNLTNDLRVPVVMAVLRHRLRGRAIVTIGLAAHADFCAAACKAALEAAGEYERLRERSEDPALRDWRPAADFGNVVDFEWHGHAYLDERMQEHLAFLTASPEEQPLDSLHPLPGSGGELLRSILDRSIAQLPDVVAVDLATREFAELGVHAVKVMAPAAVPLHADHRFPWLGHRRLYETPQRLGIASCATTPESLNPLPHPFS